MEHLMKVKEIEAEQMNKALERQAIFEEAFHTEIQYYKESGTIPSNITIIENYYWINVLNIKYWFIHFRARSTSLPVVHRGRVRRRGRYFKFGEIFRGLVIKTFPDSLRNTRFIIY